MSARREGPLDDMEAARLAVDIVAALRPGKVARLQVGGCLFAAKRARPGHETRLENFNVTAAIRELTGDGRPEAPRRRRRPG